MVASSLAAIWLLAAAGCGGPAAEGGAAHPAGGPAAGSVADLGDIHFPTSASGEAQERFLEGVLWLHSFEYGKARQAFEAAQAADRDFAMAYWGEALTYDHPLWFEEDLAAARGVLDRLAPTREARLAKAPTERERMYLEAVEALFGEGSKEERDRAYAEAMRRISEAYPDDLEAKAFHALALLGTVEGRDHATYMRAAALAEEVYQENPRHPGAVHYLIHSYDDPVHASLGLRAARVYADIAPAAVHAQHMPSHIFLALGMWDDVAASNIASAETARAEGGENYHALHWLMYAYVQQGKRADARRVLAEMAQSESPESLNRVPGSLRAGARYYVAFARANYVVDTREWDRELASLEIDTEGVEIAASAADAFLAGFAALKRGEPAAARAALATLRARRAAAERTGREYGPAVAAARIMEKELEGLLLLETGSRERGLALLREAAADEDAMSFEFGPPRVVKPTHELLGETLLAEGRAAEAAERFRRALELAPRRALSLLGLARAAEAAGDHAAAAEAYGELRKMWANADRDMPDLAEVRGTAAGTGAGADAGTGAGN